MGGRSRIVKNNTLMSRSPLEQTIPRAPWPLSPAHVPAPPAYCQAPHWPRAGGRRGSCRQRPPPRLAEVDEVGGTSGRNRPSPKGWKRVRRS